MNSSVVCYSRSFSTLSCGIIFFCSPQGALTIVFCRLLKRIGDNHAIRTFQTHPTDNLLDLFHPRPLSYAKPRLYPFTLQCYGSSNVQYNTPPLGVKYWFLGQDLILSKFSFQSFYLYNSRMLHIFN